MISISTIKSENNQKNNIPDSKQLVRDLTVFNSSITHEIKAPIRAIDSYARIFMEDYALQIDSAGLEILGNIRSICKDTLTLVNTLLEYTKLTDTPPVKEPLNLKQLISTVFEELQVVYPGGNKMKLHFKGEVPFLSTDPFLMKQVITNIISNSFKFTKDVVNPVITVGCHCKNNTPIFYIKDNGVGFDMKFSNKLFEMFHRMHSLEDFEGSGLGLAIVKKMIEKLGGTVWITGEAGNGACTYFSLPLEDILNNPSGNL